MVHNQKGGSAQHEGRVLNKIAFCGTHGTGKTTLAELVALHTKLHPLTEKVVGSRPTTAARLLGYQRSSEVPHDQAAVFQMLALCEQYRCERDVDRFVTDRSALDYLAYYRFRLRPRLRETLYASTVLHMASRYDAIAYLPPLPGPIEDNGMRWTAHQQEIDALLRGMIEEFGLSDRVIRITSDGPTERWVELEDALRQRGFRW